MVFRLPRILDFDRKLIYKTQKTANGNFSTKKLYFKTQKIFYAVLIQSNGHQFRDVQSSIFHSTKKRKKCKRLLTEDRERESKKSFHDKRCSISLFQLRCIFNPCPVSFRKKSVNPSLFLNLLHCLISRIDKKHFFLSWMVGSNSSWSSLKRREETHVQETVGSNPSTGYWMDIIPFVVKIKVKDGTF